MANERRSQAGGGKSADDSMQAGKEGGAPARTEDQSAPEGQQAEPREQTAEDRTSAPENGERQQGEPGIGANAVERSTESQHDDSTEFDAGRIDKEKLPEHTGPGGR